MRQIVAKKEGWIASAHRPCAARSILSDTDRSNPHNGFPPKAGIRLGVPDTTPSRDHSQWLNAVSTLLIVAGAAQVSHLFPVLTQRRVAIQHLFRKHCIRHRASSASLLEAASC